MPRRTVQSYSIKAGYGFVKLDNGESFFLIVLISRRTKNWRC